MRYPPRPCRGFTLIELLVVIAIIAILAGILFPVFAKARDRARAAACVSNARQIGMAVRMYVHDNRDAWPVFQAYNTQQPHLGIEVVLLPYTKDRDVFRCPSDNGGPALDGTGLDTYHAAFGCSYRFSKGCFSVVNGLSRENDTLLSLPTRIITDGMFVFPAETRIIRDEMMPWADPKVDRAGRYFYEGWYRTWHASGATIIFADGHAEFVTSGQRFDEQYVSPDGVRSIDGYGSGYD